MSSAPPKELQERLLHDPRLWVNNFLRHPNDPRRNYDFYDNSGEKFLYYIADDEGPMNPERWGDVNVLLFARGCLKTFTSTCLSAWSLDMFPTLETSVTAPRQDQTGEVISQFKKRAEESGLVERRTRDKMSHQQFENKTKDPETGETYKSYSELKARSAWGEGDGLRGLHSHVGIIDEFQDVDEGTFSVFLEAIDQQVPHVDYFPTIFLIGTPKMGNSFFHKMWEMSDQKSWNEDSRQWVAKSQAETYAPEGVDDPDLGYTIRGWHVDQYECPLHDEARIEFKRQNYSKRKFKNEVMAEFYTPEDDLLSIDVVRNTMFDKTRGWRHDAAENKTVMGIDWGGGKGEGAAKTVVTVADILPKQEDRLPLDTARIEIFDSDMTMGEEVERVEWYINNYGVDACVVDEGFGSKKREDLQEGVGTEKANGYKGTVFGCHYGNVADTEEVKWNSKDRAKRRFFTCNRTHMLESFVKDAKDGLFTIPSEDLSFDGPHSNGSVIIDHLTAPFTERTETADGKKKLKIQSDRNDDVFHSAAYAWMAAHHVGSQRTLTKIASNNMY